MFLIPYDECGEWMVDLSSVLNMETLISVVFTEEGVEITTEYDWYLDTEDKEDDEAKNLMNARRYVPLISVRGIYYFSETLSSGFGDGEADDPLLEELLREWHTPCQTKVRMIDHDVETIVYVPLDENDCAYVEIDERGYPISVEAAHSP